MSTSIHHETCPCGSGKSYQDCCGRIHAGEDQARTAEALMRARYTAFTKENEDFLLDSWHPSTRPAHVLEKNAGKTEWLGLKILSSQSGQAGDNTGTVEFIARFRVQNQPGQLHENSTFIFEDGCWFYVDGEAKKGVSAKSNKIGRNEPCPCGSGKKYKKCCGA